MYSRDKSGPFSVLRVKTDFIPLALVDGFLISLSLRISVLHHQLNNIILAHTKNILIPSRFYHKCIDSNHVFMYWLPRISLIFEMIAPFVVVGRLSVLYETGDATV